MNHYLKKLHYLLFPLLMLSVSGCATMCKEQVPTGHYGMCRTAQGFDGEALEPGWHSCWGTDATMYLIETQDKEETIPMNVLCKDSLNFSFDVSVLFSVRKGNSDLIHEMFENLTPEGEGNTISAKQVFKTYARSVIDEESRKVVSKYNTTEIVENRAQIISEVQSTIKERLSDSIVDIKRVTVNNLDFPAVVTKAQEERAKRQVEVETERAEQQKRLLQAENQLKIAEMRYKVEIVEAATIADSNKVIASSITPEYLAWWQLKVFGEAANGPNNWGFIPYTDHANGLTSTAGGTASEIVLDEALRERIREAREGATEAKPEPTGDLEPKVTPESNP